MPPKKFNWGDIPNINQVKAKDKNRKRIHCITCNVRIRVRSQFSFTECQLHTNGVKHNELTNSTALKDVPKLTKFFPKKGCLKIHFPTVLVCPKNTRKLLLVLVFIMEITLSFYLYMQSIKRMMR